MNWLTKHQKNTGCLTIDLQEDGICVAHIKRTAAARPEVTLAKSYAGSDTAVATLLDKLAKDCHAERYQCSTLLGAGDYRILAVEAPNVAPDELKTAIRWRLKNMLDFHIDDATIDVLNIPPEKNAAARNHAMYAIAARSKTIGQRQDLFGQAGFSLSIIDIPEMAQRNMAALLEPEGRGIALLSFNEQGGLLTITYGGELYLPRRIDVTLPQLLDPDAARQSACHDKVTLELQRSLDHFDRQYHFITLAKLVLAPLGRHSGLPEHLATHLQIPVETLDLNDVFDLSKVPEILPPAQQQRYFLTLGAALRQEEKAL